MLTIFGEIHDCRAIRGGHRGHSSAAVPARLLPQLRSDSGLRVETIETNVLAHRIHGRDGEGRAVIRAVNLVSGRVGDDLYHVAVPAVRREWGQCVTIDRSLPHPSIDSEVDRSTIG